MLFIFLISNLKHFEIEKMDSDILDKYVKSFINIDIFEDCKLLLESKNKILFEEQFNNMKKTLTDTTSKLEKIKKFIENEQYGLGNILFFVFKSIVFIKNSCVENEDEFIEILRCVYFIYQNPSEYIFDVKEQFTIPEYLITKIQKILTLCEEDILRLEDKLQRVLYDRLENIALDVTKFDLFIEIMSNVQPLLIHRKICKCLENEIKILNIIIHDFEKIKELKFKDKIRRMRFKSSNVISKIEYIIKEKTNYEMKQKDILKLLNSISIQVNLTEEFKKIFNNYASYKIKNENFMFEKIGINYIKQMEELKNGTTFLHKNDRLIVIRKQDEHVFSLNINFKKYANHVKKQNIIEKIRNETYYHLYLILGKIEDSEMKKIKTTLLKEPRKLKNHLQYVEDLVEKNVSIWTRMKPISYLDKYDHETLIYLLLCYINELIIENKESYPLLVDLDNIHNNKKEEELNIKIHKMNIPDIDNKYFLGTLMTNIYFIAYICLSLEKKNLNPIQFIYVLEELAYILTKEVVIHHVSSYKDLDKFTSFMMNFIINN